MARLSFLVVFLLIVFVEIQNAQIWPNGFVHPGQCPGPYQQFRQCASTCPDTCNDLRWRRPRKICTMVCRSGCDCIPPYVRLNSNPSSPCVLPRQCRFK